MSCLWVDIWQGGGGDIGHVTPRLFHWRIGCGLENGGVGGAMDELTFAILAEPNVAVHEALATQIHLLRDTLNGHAFVDVVVGLHVVGAGADCVGRVGVPNQDVGIRAY